MVAPVTGPFNKSQRIPDDAPYHLVSSRDIYRQKRPYNLPLPYDVSLIRTDVRQYTKGVNTSGRVYYSAGSNFNSLYLPFKLNHTGGTSDIDKFFLIRDLAMNKALNAFNGMKGDKAAIGVALAEVHQSIGMITKRATQVGRFINALRKFRFGEAASIIGVTKDPKWLRLSKGNRLRSSAGSYASNWLEFSFGWKPLVSDMYTAMDVLRAPLNYNSPVKAGASYKDKVVATMTYGDGDKLVTTHNCKATCNLSAVLTVENPNQDLGNRLGLTNPFAIVYEIVPWSFVLNWAVNVEEYISQWNEYYGVRVSDPFYSYKFVDDMEAVAIHLPGNSDWQVRGKADSRSMIRKLGSFPGVRLGLRPAIKVPIQRAANAISLLVQNGLKVKH